jgi:hypothetical protein
LLIEAVDALHHTATVDDDLWGRLPRARHRDVTQVQPG